jgi:hypothetical protein
VQIREPIMLRDPHPARDNYPEGVGPDLGRASAY